MHPTSGVAVLRLNPRHREEIVRHLLRLPAEDRRLRFGQSIPDRSVRRYVEGIDFGRDCVFGIHSPDLELLGVAHLALVPQQQAAELGVSVDRAARGKGYGFALLQRAVLHAANVGERVLFMVCLAENRVMLHLARKAGLTVMTERGEVEARLRLNRHQHGSVLLEALADQVALIDHLLKQQVLWLAGPRAKPASGPVAPDPAQASA